MHHNVYDVRTYSDLRLCYVLSASKQHLFMYSFLLLISQQIFIEREILNKPRWYTSPLNIFLRTYVPTKPTNVAFLRFVESVKSPFKSGYWCHRRFVYSPLFSPYHVLFRHFSVRFAWSHVVVCVWKILQLRALRKKWIRRTWMKTGCHKSWIRCSITYLLNIFVVCICNKHYVRELLWMKFCTCTIIQCELKYEFIAHGCPSSELW